MTDAQKLAHVERLKEKFDERMLQSVGFAVEEAFNDELTEPTHPLCNAWSSLAVTQRATCRQAWRRRVTKAYAELAVRVLDDMIAEEETGSA